jgi:hypothetical protein
MIYCDKIDDYVEQEETCYNCIFYCVLTDSCGIFDYWF